MLIRHEGSKATVYKDSLGYWTVGVGFLVDPKIKGAGLTLEEQKAVLRIRVQTVIDELDRRQSWWRSMSPKRQAVLADMAYNLGEDHLETFKNTLAYMKAGNYNQAATNMLASLWAKQVGKRAQELADMMRNG